MLTAIVQEIIQPKAPVLALLGDICALGYHLMNALVDS